MEKPFIKNSENAQRPEHKKMLMTKAF